MKLALWSVLGLVFVVAIVVSVSPPTPPPVTPAQQRALVELARTERAVRYFQVRLIRGDREVSEDLGRLGLNMRELQAQPIADAYQVAHATAHRLERASSRREILLALFDEVEE